MFWWLCGCYFSSVLFLYADMTFHGVFLFYFFLFRLVFFLFFLCFPFDMGHCQCSSGVSQLHSAGLRPKDVDVWESGSVPRIHAERM